VTVELGQGESVILQATDGQLPAVVRVELGWRQVPRRGLFARRAPAVDLDAIAVLYAQRQLADVVFFKHLTSNDGSVRHSGDRLVPGGGETDESIVVDLCRVPEQISQIVFAVNSSTGQTFQRIADTDCRLLDEGTGQELARYRLPGGGANTAQVMAKVFRGEDGGWRLEAIGAPARAAGFQELLPAIAAHL
jgi:tellurium resistance protein TerZ